jgi:hypothetical protein
MKTFIYTSFIVLGLIGKTWAKENIIFLSDIHFNPYGLCKNSPCPVLNQLIKADTKDWPQILIKDNIVNYRAETSNGFLIIGLKNLAVITKQNNIHTIFLTGDILAHHFDDEYFKYADKQFQNHKDFTAFSIKTSNYIIEQIKSLVNNPKIFYALGNNDGDQPDYVKPSTEFLSGFAKTLSAMLPAAEQKSFEQIFSIAGYYSLPLNDKTLIIGINSNILSAKSSEKIFTSTLQLHWLEQTLAMAQEQHKHVILLQHIPYGPDSYKSAISKTNVMLLKTPIEQQYLKVLSKYKNNISGIYAGHFHSDYFRLIANKIPMISTIAFNSFFGNNPGFKILTLNDIGYLYSYTAYYTDLAIDKKFNWQIEYQLNAAYPGNIGNIIKTISTNDISKFMYRSAYSGNSTKSREPINIDSNWAYYACSITNINVSEYTGCLYNMRYKNNLRGYLIDYFVTKFQQLFIFGLSPEHLKLL